MSERNDRVNQSGDAAFEDAARQVFERSIEELDGDVRSRLAAARVRALAEAGGARNGGITNGGITNGKPRRTSRSPLLDGLADWWSPPGRLFAGVAAVSAAAVVVWVVLMAGVTSPVEVDEFRSVSLMDLEILLGEADLDLLEELEFYTWLDELAERVPDSAAGDGVG